MDFEEKKQPPNPRQHANPLSKLLFLWIIPLFRKGYRSDLSIEDLYTVLPTDHTHLLEESLRNNWLIELEKSKLKGRKPKFLNAVFRTYGAQYLFSILFYILDQCIIIVSQPLFLRLVIRSFEPDTEVGNEKYFYAFGLCASGFLHAIVLHPAVFIIFHFGMQCRAATSSLIYRKSLRLSKSAQGKTTVGQMINLLSNDVNRFDTNLNFIPFMIAAPFQVAVFVYLLWNELGPSSLSGIGFVLILIPLQYLIGKYSAIFRLEIAKQTDERGRIMNEIIVAMRVIKMYAWEKPFSILVDRIRKLEVAQLRKRGHLRGLNMAMFTFSSKLVPYCTFLTYVLSGSGHLTADKVFFAVSIFHVLIQMMTHFVPYGAAAIGELLVSLNRIEQFLLLEEQELSLTQSSKVEETPSVHMINASASWTKDKVTLNKINLNFEGDKVVMVVGPVGSGKTSFLHSLIGELAISEGKLSVNGTTAYASQEPWIFAGNLRQNILFGHEYDEERYEATIKACALVDDLKQLPYADMTIVGERGVALSGGQKARVNLARALYSSSDIYLLDDPLSAVDTRVSRHLFEKCVKDHLKGHLRILVTHQLQYLSQADYIVVFNNGEILAQGTYDELVNSGIDFVSLLASDAEEEAQRKSSIVKLEPEQKPEKTNNGKPEEQVEKSSVGSVTARTYWEYFRSGGTLFSMWFLFVIFISAQIFMSASDIWLSTWTNAEDIMRKNATDCSSYGEYGCEDAYLGQGLYLGLYSGLVVGFFFLTTSRALYFYMYCTRISINVHNKMFTSMVRAPTKFFDENPSGRVMNRFTKDVGAMDELLPPAFIDTLQILLQMLGVVSVVIASNYYMSIPTLFLFGALGFMRQFFVKTARDVKRIESVTRSPMFTHVAATMQGITTIRAAKAQNTLIKQFDSHQDLHSSAWFVFMATNRWFGIWLELTSILFLSVVTISFFFISTGEEGGNVGLAISSVLTLTGSFQWGMRQSAETENYMTSVERALEYAKLEPEAPLESKPEKKPQSEWPQDGQLTFENMSLSYEEGKPVLKNLTFSIRSKEKIGIVGRTGAGKSSIIAALFRMQEPTGRIMIDNVVINDIGLHDLRRNISIIPQDPVLFSGTIRYNLDPFGQFDDESIWKALEEVELKNSVPALDFKVSDGGSNFSVGQRQLVCLARAILRKNRIIVMDEATANVDPRTDSFIQATIREKFAQCSIITIAHRLHSVMDCDRILVLDHGNLEEYDHPHILLQNPNGIFSAMVGHTGKASATQLKEIASETYSKIAPNQNDTQNESVL